MAKRQRGIVANPKRTTRAQASHSLQKTRQPASRRLQFWLKLSTISFVICSIIGVVFCRVPYTRDLLSPVFLPIIQDQTESLLFVINVFSVKLQAALHSGAYLTELCSSFVYKWDMENLRMYVEYLREEYGPWLVDGLCWGLLLAVVVGLIAVAVHRCKCRVQTAKSSCHKDGCSTYKDGVEVLLSDELDESDDEDGVSSSEEGGELEETSNRDRAQNLVYVERKLTPAEYLQQSEETTRNEVMKLLRSPEFRNLVKERGVEDASYNWQKRRSRKQ